MESLFLWPFLVLLDLGFMVLAMLLAPLIALFVRSDGYLPRWLWWFQTPDSRMDGCNGDANFCATHRPCWWTYVLWQWRNPCAGFSHWLGLVFDRPVIRQWGAAGEIGRLPVFRPGWHFLWVIDARGRRAFEFAATWPSLFGRCWNIRIGYKLGNLYRDPTERIPIVHRCNPLSKRGPLPDSPAKAGFFMTGGNPVGRPGEGSNARKR